MHKEAGRSGGCGGCGTGWHSVALACGGTPQLHAAQWLHYTGPQIVSCNSCGWPPGCHLCHPSCSGASPPLLPPSPCSPPPSLLPLPPRPLPPSLPPAGSLLLPSPAVLPLPLPPPLVSAPAVLAVRRESVLLQAVAIQLTSKLAQMTVDNARCTAPTCFQLACAKTLKQRVTDLAALQLEHRLPEAAVIPVGQGALPFWRLYSRAARRSGGGLPSRRHVSCAAPPPPSDRSARAWGVAGALLAPAQGLLV